LFEVRPDSPFTLHLTYPVGEIDKKRKEEWEKQQKKEKTHKKPGGIVREEWSDEKHSLKALLNEKLAPGQKLSIVVNGEPHVIDLLDPVGL